MNCPPVAASTFAILSLVLAYTTLTLEASKIMPQVLLIADIAPESLDIESSFFTSSWPLHFTSEASCDGERKSISSWASTMCLTLEKHVLLWVPGLLSFKKKKRWLPTRVLVRVGPLMCCKEPGRGKEVNSQTFQRLKIAPLQLSHSATVKRSTSDSRDETSYPLPARHTQGLIGHPIGGFCPGTSSWRNPQLPGDPGESGKSLQ